MMKQQLYLKTTSTTDKGTKSGAYLHGSTETEPTNVGAFTLNNQAADASYKQSAHLL
jgi:hypothetical protein